MSNTDLFQTIQFSISAQFSSILKLLYFKQFSLAKVRSLNVKSILLQTIQFSISTQFECQNSPISHSSV